MNYFSQSEARQKYLAQVASRPVLFIGRNKKIYEAIIAYFQSESHIFYGSAKERSDLYEALWPDETRQVADIFAGPARKVLLKLLGKEWAEKFQKVMARIPDYIYATGYERRSFRAGSEQIYYLATAVHRLENMIDLAANGFTYEYYLTQRENKFEYNRVIADLLALEIDEGNQEVLRWIKEMVYGDNNTGLLTGEIIRGLLMSHNSDAHRWVGELLLAAKLQEGLRQTITECMDEGSKEGFIYILNIILENDLIRFSSVVRALDVWTGLGISAQKPAVIKKCLETAWRCLTEESYAHDCLTGDDAMLIYMGLWTKAFSDVFSTAAPLKQLLAAPEKYRKITALYFLHQTGIPLFQHQLAVPLLSDPEKEVRCWALFNIYPDTNRISLRPEHKDGLAKYKLLKDQCPPEDLFDRLKNILDHLPVKGLTFTGSPFPWCYVSVTADEVIVKMLITMSEKAPLPKVDAMLDYRQKMSPETRDTFIRTFLDKPGNARQKTAIVEFMGDKSSTVRSTASQIAEKLELSTEDYLLIEDSLKYKSGDLRKNAISMLLRQSPPTLLMSIRRLVGEKNENKVLAALDIIGMVENNPQYEKIKSECRQIAETLSDTSQRTKVLAQKITGNDTPVYTAANGFGLYDPNQQITLPGINYPQGFTVKKLLSSNMDEIKQVLSGFSHLIEQHKSYEYEAEDWNGSIIKVILGGEYNIRIKKIKPGGKPNLEDYPLPEVWREAAQQYKLTTQKMMEILFYYHVCQYGSYAKTEKWYTDLVMELFANNREKTAAYFKELSYSNHIQTILTALFNECPSKEIFRLCRDMAAYLYQKTPIELFTRAYEKKDQHYYYSSNPPCLVDAKEYSFWQRYLRENWDDDQSFREGLSILYALYKASAYKSPASLQIQDFERAYRLGLVDENELYAELCGRPLSKENLNIVTNDQRYGHKEMADCFKIREVTQKVIDRVLEIELKRGDMTTEVSHLASKINRCTGTRFLADILVGAEKDTYVRGYNFVGDDSTKKQIFSHVLKNCYPAESEDENTLRELLKRIKVSDKQLVDAAMYAPQWLEIAEKVLDWPGLKSAGWYFHAHVNETFSTEKETIVARYSPVSPQDFKDGAFDIDWFHEAYAAVGEKRFQVVYDSAKYIAGGGLHKRAQLFADVVLGKISKLQAETIIKEKRNKDYVLAYGLIPLDRNLSEALHRYEFLQSFLKESRQFGAQRRESEGKAVAIALENLARNAGYQDIIRFRWSMETEKMKEIAPYLQPADINGILLNIGIDELGIASIAASKDGKVLKDIPSKLKNEEYVKEIKAVQKSLKDQHSRARVSLEKAMEAGDEFTVAELQNLAENPVICPLLKNLVFLCGKQLGFFQEQTLIAPDNKKYRLQPQDKCLLAHPIYLYESGNWSVYQKFIYDRSIVQPFKQVFRELYKPNMDELEAGTISHRYDGHQIQPKKTVALLRGRGWTVSYDEGLQKVYYKENIIAQFYAMADWFSPAEIEAPTIDGIEFRERRTGRGLLISDIPKVIFSEIMRDLDLVVSVAHVGGVDPEASLSTIEMRTVIITEMLRLLKLSNVKINGSHAFIQGTLGEYTVHLGSALVHKMASGAVHILPVHSQHKGRIFLPFLDSDPKTAEIISKIIFLAEDHKIKDPNILTQITN